MMGDKERDIIAQCRAHLEREGVGADFEEGASSSWEREGHRPDGWLTVDASGRTHRFVVEVRGAERLLPARAEYLLHLLRDSEPWVVFAEHVSQEAAEKLRKGGAGYVDASGNMHLAAPGLLMHVQGRPRRASATPKASRVFQGVGLRVVFLFLAKPGAVNWTQREIADVAGVAQGNLPGLFRDLKEQGFLVQVRKGERRLADTVKLLDRWETAYAERLRNKLLVGRYRQIRSGGDMDELARRVGEFSPAGEGERDRGVLVGGELGATLLHADVLFGPRGACLHVPKGIKSDRARLTEFLAHCGLAPDPRGEVAVLSKMTDVDEGDLRSVGNRLIALADPVLMRAELVGTGLGRDERVAVLADRLLERDILPRLKGTAHE